MADKIKLNSKKFEIILRFFELSLEVKQTRESLNDYVDFSSNIQVSTILNDIKKNKETSRYIIITNSTIKNNIELHIENVINNLEWLNKRSKKLKSIEQELDKSLLEYISLKQDREQEFSLTFSDILFTKDGGSSNPILNGLFFSELSLISKLTLKNCDACTEEIDLKNIKLNSFNLEVCESKLGKLILTQINDNVSSLDISLNKSEVDNFILDISDKIILKIVDSEITKFDINIPDVPVMKYFHFSSKSEIIENKRISYGLLQTIARSMKDTIQEHILYVKSLNAFKESNESNRDDKILIWLNDYVNCNGTSFILPLILLFVINTLFIFIIFYYGNLDTDFWWNTLNINPIDKLNIPSNNSAFQAVDALRRTLLTVFIFLITSAALRFRFKK